MTATRFLRRCCMGAALVVAAALAGCATGPREITSSVQSYANMGGIHLPATYRMELLPSQTHQQSFARIEAAAQDALQRVGLTRDPRPDLARLVVQIGASADQGYAYHPGYDNWFYGPRFGWGLGMGFGGPRWGMGMSWMDAPPMVYYRGVQLVIRDTKTQQIVYATSAKYDEIRVDDQQIWRVLFDAALSDFPHPPQGARQVRTTITPLPAAKPATDAAPASGSTPAAGSDTKTP